MEVIDSLSITLTTMNKVLSLLPEEVKVFDNKLSKKTESTKVFESPHPYRSNMDETVEVNFPGNFVFKIFSFQNC
jgi:hypothetical protein